MDCKDRAIIDYIQKCTSRGESVWLMKMINEGNLVGRVMSRITLQKRVKSLCESGYLIRTEAPAYRAVCKQVLTIPGIWTGMTQDQRERAILALERIADAMENIVSGYPRLEKKIVYADKKDESRRQIPEEKQTGGQ